MATVLLANTYFLSFDQKQQRLMQPYPPLATLYAAAVLRQKGYEVALHDAILSQSVNEIIPVFEKEKPAFFVIYDDGFNYLTKMCLTNMREAAFQMIAIARQYGCTIIISSSDATDHAEAYLRKGADYVIKGEAEITLRELLHSLTTGNNVLPVAGLAFLSGNEVVSTPKRSVLQQLDDIPFPAWDLVDMHNYQKKWRQKNGYFSLNLTTTRGCPFKCNWCAKPIYGNRYNSRSPQNVVEEIKLLLRNYQPDHFWFCDDIFGLKPGWIKTFSELVQQEQLHFRFKIQCRVDLLLEENNIESLARAGCETIWVGAESGSQKILDAMDKGTTVEQIYAATKLLKKHNIRPAFFLQFGYPGETKEDIAATKKMLLELMPDDLGISVSYPLPGTKFYETVKDQLKEKANWTDSDDLDMMYRGTYSPQYYRQLHRYIHKLYRRQQGWERIKQMVKTGWPAAGQSWRSIVLLPYFTIMSWWNYCRLNYLIRN